VYKTFPDISSVEGLILRDRQITVHDVAANSGLSVENIEIVTHENIFFKKMCAQSLVNNQKLQLVGTSKHFCILF
jgi:hypothetical protein